MNPKEKAMMAHPSELNMLPCIWMEAGVIGYKLCDRDLQCDGCPFDAMMKPPFPENPDAAGRAFHGGPAAEARVDHTPEHLVDAFFAPFTDLTFPEDRSYTAGHLWMKEEEALTVVIGMDHIAAGLIGPVTGVVLPRKESHVTRQAPCCWILHDQTALTFFSPFTGSVAAINSALNESPELVSTDPYGSGWILRIQAENSRRTIPDRSSAEHRQSVQAELQRLREGLFSSLNRRPPIGKTLLDGGSNVDSVIALVGAKAFFDLVARCLLPKQ